MVEFTRNGVERMRADGYPGLRVSRDGSNPKTPFDPSQLESRICIQGGETKSEHG